MKKFWADHWPLIVIYAFAGALIGIAVVAAVGLPGTQPFKRHLDFQPRTVTLYAADGSQIGRWHTKGKVYSEGNSDGWFFVDANDNRLKMVTGTVLIEADKP
jgi:hypothetical protein